MNALQNGKVRDLYKAGVLASIVLSLVIGGFNVASAESATPIKDIRTAAKDARKDIRAEATSTRRAVIQGTQAEIKDLKAGASKENRASTSAAIQAIREGRRDDLQSNRASTSEAVKIKKDALLKDIAKRKGDKKKKLDAQATSIVQKALSSAYGLFNDRIIRLNKVDANLNAQINQLTGKGVDTSATAALLATARTSFEKAKVDVQASGTLSHEQAATSTSNGILKDLIKTAETSIKTAATNYRAVAESVKSLTPSVDANAEVSASTSITVAP